MRTSIRDQAVVQQWLHKLQDSRATVVKDRPNYWSDDPETLISTSNIHSLEFGTGCGIYSNSILPAIATAESEVVLVTCFWASSRTLEHLNATLVDLSAKALRNDKKIRVRICFSSLSIFQKLFHTTSLEGQTYPPSQWRTKLGLTAPDELKGLELEVKSIFVRAFSVMHPKFVIIDRQKAFLPSCNVSWEDWFEGCVELTGPVVGKFVEFWISFWAYEQDRKFLMDQDDNIDKMKCNGSALPNSTTTLKPLNNIQSIFLPSPHHRNPQFALLPWKQCPAPPSTPLNVFLRSAFRSARKDIYIQTPNLTAQPVLSALLAALKRGVDVGILTSERLMILEQLVTAGTTTSRCIKKLIKRHALNVKEWDCHSSDPAALEAGAHLRPGKLTVDFYEPDTDSNSSGEAEPSQSHLKLTIIDGEWTVLGSGNMDRASWYTSQELGVAFHSRDFAADVRGRLDPLLKGRKRPITK